MNQAILQFVRASYGVTAAALSLRIRGFARSCSSLLTLPDAGVRTTMDVQALITAYRRTDGRLPWSTCLTRSLALCRTLRRARLPAALRLGVSKQGTGLHAHAWVELDGQALESVGHLTPLPLFDPAFVDSESRP